MRLAGSLFANFNTTNWPAFCPKCVYLPAFVSVTGNGTLPTVTTGFVFEDAATEQREHWHAARDMYSRSLKVYQEMQKRGFLTGEDTAKPQEVAREIARCDASLQRSRVDVGTLRDETSSK